MSEVEVDWGDISNEVLTEISYLATPMLKKVTIALIKRYLPATFLSTWIGGIVIIIAEWIFDRFIIPYTKDLKIVVVRGAERIELKWKIKRYKNASTNAEFDLTFDDLIK